MKRLWIGIQRVLGKDAPCAKQKCALLQVWKRIVEYVIGALRSSESRTRVDACVRLSLYVYLYAVLFLT